MQLRYRAEQVGSLLRPPELLHARRERMEGRLDERQLRAAEDRAIEKAVQKQRNVGLDVYTHGELRRESWLTDMADAVEGFVTDRVIVDWKGPEGGPEASSANAVGAKLRKQRNLTAHEVPFLQEIAQGPIKITLPAPSNFIAAS